MGQCTQVLSGEKGKRRLVPKGTDDYKSQHYALLLGLQGRLQMSASNRELGELSLLAAGV